MKVQADSYVQAYADSMQASYSKETKTAQTTESTASKTDSKTSDKQTGATVEISSAGQAMQTADKVTAMSKSERKALVNQLKADQANRQSQLVSLVEQMMNKQTTAYGKSTGTWKFLASGNYTVDAKTKLQAQADIAEDGFYGVKQTSERMYQFALALSGGDEDKMKDMQAAIEKGYKKAEKTWGGKLPDISRQTMDATNKLFDDFFKGKSAAETTETES